MAKTWYSVLNIELIIGGTKTLKVGTIFAVKKLPGDLVACTELEGAKTCYTIRAQYCKKVMSRPTLDLDSAIEYSILQCEAAYC